MLIHNAEVTGSLTINNVPYNSGSFSGSFQGDGSQLTGVTGATTASYVEYSNVGNKPALVSGSSQITYSGLSGIPSGIVSGSSQVTYGGLSGIPAGIVSSSAQVGGYGIFATTGSNQFDGSQAITGSLTVTGQVVAQTLNVQEVTSSIVFSSGSNIFGNSLANTQQFTGSVSVTGSLTVTTAGTELQVTSTGVNLGNALTDSHIISGSLTVNPNGLFVSGSGVVGIGTVTPNSLLEAVSSTFGQIRVSNFTTTGANRGSSFRATSTTNGGTNFLGDFNAISNNSFAPYNGVDGVYLMSRTSGFPLGLTVNNAGTEILALNIVSTGAATFSSSVTTGGVITSDSATTADLPATSGTTQSGGHRLRLTTNGANTAVIDYGTAGGSGGWIQAAIKDSLGTNLPLLLNPNGGNVGIGTASPDSGLTIDATSTVFNALSLRDTRAFNASPEAALAFRVKFNSAGNFGTPALLVAYKDNATDGNQAGGITFWTNANAGPTERMRITSGGNVEIGTSSPSGTKALTIQAGTNSSASLRLKNDAHDWDVNCQTNDRFAIYSHTDSVERLVITPTSGNVLIGTTTDSGYKVNVNGSISLTSGNSFKATYNSTDDYHGALSWATLQLGNNGDNRIIGGRTAAGGNLKFYVNNTNDATNYSTVPNGTLALTLASTGVATFSNSVTYSVGFTSYTPDGLFSASANPGKVITPSGTDRILLGYFDQGGGQYWGRIGFKGNTNWSLGTSQGGDNFSIGTNNGNNQFLITSTGAVTTPDQPAWSVGLNGAQSYLTNVPSVIFWNQSSGNDCFIQGGVTLNGDLGRITVPVAGKYMLFASIRTEAIGAATGTNLNLRRNGTTILRYYVGESVNSTGSFMYIETRPVIINCAANDYIDFQFDSITGDFILSATSNTVVRFGGFLMG
jgi:hypothetical protein